MGNQTVSVIVPVYNTQDYLPGCIESILGQTYEDLELILVDDGSRDGSLEICNRYARQDSRITVLTKENGGQGTARNLALDCAPGAYLSFVDSDDAVAAGMLEAMVGHLERTGAQIAVCGIEKRYDSGRCIRDQRPPAAEYSNEALMRAYVSTGLIHTGPCNKVYRRELFEDLRFPPIRANEDAYIMHRVLGRCQKAVVLPEHYYLQNIREGSTEQKAFTRENLAALDCARELMQYYEENYPALYPLVAYKEAEEAAALMCRILRTGVYRTYHKEYNSLRKQMNLQYQKARQAFPEGRRTALLRQAAEHSVGFFLKYSLWGIRKKYTGR